MIDEEQFVKFYIEKYGTVWSSNRNKFTGDCCMGIRKNKWKYYIVLLLLVIIFVVGGIWCDKVLFKQEEYGQYCIAFGISIMAGTITAFVLEISDNRYRINIETKRFDYDLVRVYGIGRQLVDNQLKVCCDFKNYRDIVRDQSIDLLDCLVRYQGELECFWGSYALILDGDFKETIKNLSTEIDQCKQFVKRVVNGNEFNAEFFGVYSKNLNKILSDDFLLCNYVLRMD